MEKKTYSADQLEIPQFKNNELDSLKFFNENGFHIEKNIIDENLCKDLIKESNTFENSLNKSYKPEMQLHKNNTSIMNFMKNKKITSIVKKIIGQGEKIFALQSSFFYGVSGTTGSLKHQDSLYTSPETFDSFLSVWIPLVNINVINMGNLFFYSKSHKLGSLDTKEINNESVKYQNKNLGTIETVFDEEGYKKIVLTASPGSLVFLHSNLVHGSLNNNSIYNRYVLLLTYIRDGVSFREGREAKRTKVNIE